MPPRMRFAVPENDVGHDTHYDYELVSRHGELVFVAGQIPKVAADRILRPGVCGAEHDLGSARESAALAARQALHWIETACEPGETVARILRLTVYVAQTDTFTEMSEVADAASRVFIDRLGAGGRHVRSVVGVRRLPRNAPVLVEATACVKVVTPD